MTFVSRPTTGHDRPWPFRSPPSSSSSFATTITMVVWFFFLLVTGTLLRSSSVHGWILLPTNSQKARKSLSLATLTLSQGRPCCLQRWSHENNHNNLSDEVPNQQQPPTPPVQNRKKQMSYTKYWTRSDVVKAGFASSMVNLVLGSSLSSSFIVLCSSSPSQAFEGGIGGLGKTKPETGVQFLTNAKNPVQQTSQGFVTAELLLPQQNKPRPIVVSFQAPWPLLPTTGGLEVRDLQQPESAFVQVIHVPPPSSWPLSAKDFQTLLLDTVFGQQGKFGAYGAPTDVKVKRIVRTTEDDTVTTTTTTTASSSSSSSSTAAVADYSVTFVALTPGQRETERHVLIRAVVPFLSTTTTNTNNAPSSSSSSSSSYSVVLWVVGTTQQRFASKQTLLQQVLTSFQAYPAPETRFVSA